MAYIGEALEGGKCRFVVASNGVGSQTLLREFLDDRLFGVMEGKAQDYVARRVQRSRLAAARLRQSMAGARQNPGGAAAVQAVLAVHGQVEKDLLLTPSGYTELMQPLNGLIVAGLERELEAAGREGVTPMERRAAWKGCVRGRFSPVCPATRSRP